jgi:hypothetical protein
MAQYEGLGHYGQNRIQPMMSDTKDVSMDFFLNFPHMGIFFLKSLCEGFEAVWLSAIWVTYLIVPGWEVGSFRNKTKYIWASQHGIFLKRI